MAAETPSAQPATPDFAKVYSEFAAGLDFEDLSPETVAAIRLNLFDTLACSIAGATAVGIPELRDIVAEWGGKPEAAVLWSDLRVPAAQAAWVNGSMCHARDYDDTHDRAILHAGVSVVPAAFAAAEIAGRPVSGRELYAGVAAGLELICRAGCATGKSLIDTGFLYTSLFGYFAATVAACRVLGMSAEDTHNALGIVLSQAAGSHQVTRDAAWTKRMGPGFAARGALTAVAMARKGIRGARQVFDGVDGVGNIYLQGSFDSQKAREGLGRRYDFVDLSYKPYPCCRFNHTAIDAALALRGQPGFDWRKVSAVTAYVNSAANQAVGTPLAVRQAPATVVQAQFSICYTIAAALVNGTVGIADFATEAFTRADVMRLAARVTPVVDDAIEREWGRNVGPTRVELVMDGRTVSVQVDEAKGSLGNPMSEGDLMRKLEDCLAFGGFDPASAGHFRHVIDRLAESRDVAADYRALIDRIRADAARARRTEAGRSAAE